MRASLALTFVFWLLGAQGCSARMRMTPPERGRVAQALTQSSKSQYLQLSFYVTPFYGDLEKRLLTAVPPEEASWMLDASGQPLSPGRVERILPAGLRARVKMVTFPSGFELLERRGDVPRDFPWIYLEVEGQPPEVPLVLVMPAHLRDAASFLSELEHHLSSEEPGPRINAWGEAVKTAIEQKRAIPDMVADALEMAWGRPQFKRIVFQNEVRTEEWRYAGGRRSAELVEGRVVRLTPPSGN